MAVSVVVVGVAVMCFVVVDDDRRVAVADIVAGVVDYVNAVCAAAACDDVIVVVGSAHIVTVDRLPPMFAWRTL